MRWSSMERFDIFLSFSVNHMDENGREMGITDNLCNGMYCSKVESPNWLFHRKHQNRNYQLVPEQVHMVWWRGRQFNSATLCQKYYWLMLKLKMKYQIYNTSIYDAINAECVVAWINRKFRLDKKICVNRSAMTAGVELAFENKRYFDIMRWKL